MSQPYEAPADPLEQRLAQIWQELLGVERVGRHDNFFELGGHSLLAVRVIVRVRQELGVESSLRALFNQPELAAFAKSVEQAGASLGQHLGQRITPADRSAALPVSYAQQRLWFLDRLDAAAGAAYHMPVALRLSGALQRQALKATLDGLVRRHEILRTRFGSVDGQTVQWIDGPEVGFQWQEVDLSGLEEPQRTQAVQSLSQEEQRAPFDLARGPLIRGQLLKLEEQAHILLLTQHHIISDGWSTGIMVREVSALYEAYSQGREDPLEPLTIQYADYAVWQRQWLQGEVLRQQTQYWKEQLGGAPALLELPTDRPRPVEQSYEGGQWRFEIPAQVSAGLQGLAQSQGATLFMTLLAGWAVLLSRLSGQKDIVVGTPVANRQRSEVEGLIGFFVNTLALRVRLEDDPTVQELLQQVKASTLDAYEHQDLPFEQVVEALQPQRSLSHSPLFQNMLSLNNTPVQGPLQLSGLSISTLAPDSGSTQFDLSLALSETPEGLSATLSYASALYEPSSIQRLEGYLQAVLRGLVEDPTQRVSELALLSAAQRRQVLEEFNATARAYPQDELIHELFEEQVRARPQATALVYEQQQLSYGELNERANQVAHRLVQLGIRPDDRVAICMQRSVEMVVGLLGILKSGAAYVPLDPAYPAARLAYMLGDSEPGAVLTQQALVQEMRQGVAIGVPVLALDGAEAAQIEVQPRHDPDPQALGLNARHLAYIIYTSGSTGQPKGVMVEHRQVLRLLAATEDWFHFDHHDVWTLFHSFAFDFSVWELWGALAKGGKLVLVPYLTSRSPQAFYELLSTQRVTVLNQTPSAFRQLIAAQSSSPLEHSLRLVVFGGEALEPAMLKPWFDRDRNANVRLVNMYGITETTVHVTYLPVDPSMAQRRGTSPIGRPIPDLRIYVLDAAGQPVPLGVTGEMYVGGDGLARGYLNRPELTQQRFLADPFSPQPNARMYRTGDLARWLEDGSLEYLGRNDHQVKIRGFRIELGEIEARLAQCHGVRDAVVLPRDDEAGQQRLVAYLTAQAGHALTAAALRSHLSAVLADYMVPSAFVVLPELPLTANGKLDRQALPAPDASAHATHPYQAPTTPTEALLCRVWCEVLGLTQVGVNDNFFDVGGDSIRSIAIVAKARSEGVNLAIVDLFKSPTIRGLAQLLSSGAATEPVDEASVQLSEADRRLLPADVEEAYPVTMLQMGMVFHNAHDEESGLYHDITTNQLTLPAWNPAAMRTVLDAMVRRHPALRTAFDLHRYSEPMQVVHASASLPLEVFDVQHLEVEAQDRLIADFMRQEHQTRFTLETPPLLRVFVHLRSAHSIQITLSFHHAILDGWSLAALQTGLVNAYARLVAGEAVEVTEAPLDVTPRHTIAQERQALRSEAHRAFWADYLADCEFAALPAPEPEVEPEAPRNEAVELSEGLCAQLRALASSQGVPMRSLLLAAHVRMVATLSGVDDVTTGLVANVRPERTNGDQVLGLFLNTLPFRQKLEDMSWKALIRQIHDNEIGVMAYRHYPYFQLYVDHNREPFYETTFNYINFHVYEGLHAGIKAEGFRGDIEVTNNALAVDCFQRPNQAIGIKIDARSLSVAQERRVRGYFVAILEAMARDPEALHGGQSFLSDRERHDLLERFNATASVRATQPLIHRGFEERAAAHPDAVAVSHDGRLLTYGEVNARANALAHQLLRQGVRPDDKVAICMERCPDQLIGLLGILKAGGAYVPLDPQHPQERLNYMLQDCDPVVLIVQPSLRDRFEGVTTPLITIDPEAHGDQSTQALSEGRNPDIPALGPSHLAYVIYTSGSTGLPKGVLVEHGNAVNLIEAHIRTCQLTEADRVLQLASFGFDNSITEIFPTLQVGGRIVMRPATLMVPDAEFMAFLAEHGVTVADLPTSFWHLWSGEIRLGRSLPWDALRLVIVGGEKAELRHLQDWAAARKTQHIRWINTYGPTEATVYATVFPWLPSDGLPPQEVPIGRPVDNTVVRILDRFGQLSPVGVMGEIYLGGPQVARGYYKRPELTQSRFIADPYGAEASRLYRTGDLGRWTTAGMIEYVGRNDFQVKIRGHRIEMGEIEARLAECPSVREAVVLARAGEDGDKRLVAYITAHEGLMPLSAELRSALLATLPEYMVPSAFVVLERMPLTPHGKLDRQALPEPGQASVVTQTYEPPVGAVEQAIAEIWQDLLELEQVGRNDHFFELGGHSLMAVSLIEHLRQRGLMVPVRSIFAAPTLADFARAVEQRQDAGAEAPLPVTPGGIEPGCQRVTPEMLPLVNLSQSEIDGLVASVPAGISNLQDIYPLAPLQAGILFHHMLETTGDPYLLRLVLGFDSRDRLDRFLDALQRVIDRHDILRSAFEWEGLSSPVQVVWRKATLPVEAVSLVSKDDALGEFLERVDPRQRRLDLRRAPLLAAYVAADTSSQSWFLTLLNHHLIGDHVTLDLIVDEVRMILEGRSADLPAPASYREFVASALKTDQAAHDAYFARLLGDVTEPTAPFGLLDVQGSGEGVRETLLPLTDVMAGRINSLARQLAVTPAVVFHVGWALLLSRCTGRADVVFGTVLLGRMQGVHSAQQVLGMFINTLPVRIALGSTSVEEAVRACYGQLTELLVHEQASLGLAQRCSGVKAPMPLFTTLLNYRHIQGGEGAAGDANGAGLPGVVTYAHEERINYPVGAAVNDLGGAYSLSVQCDGVDPVRVAEMFVRSVEVLLEALEGEPTRALASLDPIPTTEQIRLLEDFNATAVRYEEGELVQERFEAQVRMQPQAVAVEDDTQVLSYAELNERANRVAHRLLALGIEPDDRVAICMSRGVEMVVGVLGILKSGAAYVPLDPAYPAARLAYMLSDCEPAVVLTEQALVSAVREVTPTGVALLVPDGEDGALLQAQPVVDPDTRRRHGLHSRHLAYIIYTSGSTGQPKGVQIEHRSVVNFLSAMTGLLRVSSEDAVLAVTTLSFDIAGLELYLPLINGARMVLVSRETASDASLLEQALERSGVTLMQATPVTWRMLLDNGWTGRAGLRMLCGGEALSGPLAQRLSGKGAQLWNLYGPTETTVWSTACCIDPVQAGVQAVQHIGRPIANTRIYILDGQGRPVPIGVVGEIHIGGHGVARGYWKRPDLTQQRFVEDGFSGEAGARLYKTGDLGRWLADGDIEYLGRNDHQVKIRGFRIELGEIEARLVQCPGVREAVVVAREDQGGDKRLVAYVSAQEGAQGEALAVSALRSRLAEALADYMVPSAFVVLAGLPLTPNGKIDRQALPAPEAGALVSQPYEAPADPLEQRLAQIWQELLGVERVGRHDNFFELGGHSLLAVRVIVRVRQELGVESSLRALFNQPELAAFAKSVEQAGASLGQRIGRADRSAALPVSYAQQRLWFLDRLDAAAGAAYHMPVALRLSGALQRQALKATLDGLVRRHEILRTRFGSVDGQTVQWIDGPEVGFQWQEVDLSGLEEPQRTQAVQSLSQEEQRAPFDLARGPLIRGQLLKLEEQAHILLLTQHHIISDGWSTGIMVREVSALYEAYSQGREDPLEPLTIQYADYAVWQRQWLQGEVLRQQTQYWKEQLGGAPALLELPTDRPRPAEQSYEGGQWSFEIPAQVSAGLQGLAQSQGATLFMTLLAGWAVLLSRLSGQKDIVVGTPVANRQRSEVEGLIGFFVNTLALRVRLEDDPTVQELLQQVKASTLDAYEHQDLPFEQVVEALQPQRSLSHSPLFQNMLSLNNTPVQGPLQLSGLSISTLAPDSGSTQFDLSLALSETPEGLSATLSYASALYEPSSIQRLEGYLQAVLRGLVEDPTQRVSELALLSAAQRRQVLEEFNATARAYPQDELIHELFEEQVRARPQATALVYEQQQLSYGELNERANQVAHRLVQLGIRPDDRVAICMQRSVEMVVGLLGILKSGAAYVPLDPAYPAARLAYMLGDSEPGAVLTQQALVQEMRQGVAIGVPVLALDGAEAAQIEVQPRHDPDPQALGLNARHLAYIIYTSGSTGQPKGVMVEHAGLSSLAHAQIAQFGVNPTSRVLQFVSISFDVCISEIAMTLCSGATLLLAPANELLPGDPLLQSLRSLRATHITLPRAALAALPAEASLGEVRTLITGGELLQSQLAATWSARYALFNSYGPTETTVCATVHDCRETDLAVVPIGRPMAGKRIYILDDHGAPVPLGARGEIHIGGIGVARGYWNQPELTQQRFLPDPHCTQAGARMYRTGDLGRWRPDGQVEFLGRNDHQVKIRGFRIELG
ncbi:amino acid adenylation domain-containing protein, partial [Roseateles sp. SL47]|uniref:amino acid adenylation domain-containing protein n=1 Tax=Roseateles sp. SL47 TaxID=2995138 RepID=UPI003B63DF69